MRAAEAKDAPETRRDAARACKRIDVRGQIQGVGFRPFVYHLARDLSLGGFVANTGSGVRIEVEGAPSDVARFLSRLRDDLPPLAAIDHLEATDIPLERHAAFAIRDSDRRGAMRARVLPDVATCAECLREINDPGDRRYQYPFTNCTHCGPRYSIITAMPYDRPCTTMASFALCPACRREYSDPADRRFHAQPIACPDCGPQLALWDVDGAVLATRGDAMARAVEAVATGKIVALKGLGGFQLLADAGNADAVNWLRQRKHREAKPFAVMVPDLQSAFTACAVTPAHEVLLQSPQAPIVLIPSRPGLSGIDPSVAPDTDKLGVMLPCTPLHHLLLAAFGRPLVVTSGNRGEEPICIDEFEALDRLRGIADLFLVHNRPIARQVDDSVVAVIHGEPMMIRRARGYAPAPVAVAGASDGVLAVGAHLKNTVAFVKEGAIIPSQHIGNLDNVAAVEAFHRTVESMKDLFRVMPSRVVHDLHPDYASTRFALGCGLTATPLQHHYAHVLSCMAEHGLDGPVLGVAWDGTGYGPDGTIWGGEFLVCTRAGYERVASLRPFALPGGDVAVRDARRPALSLLRDVYSEELADLKGIPTLDALNARDRGVIEHMIDTGLNTPATTSMGRLFDAVASLCGLCHHSAFEGQAAMRLETAAGQCSAPPVRLEFALERVGDRLHLDWRPVIREIVTQIQYGQAAGPIALGFHHALADAILRTAVALDVNDIVLTGGCFQNMRLLEHAVSLLTESACTVYRHHDVPPNDGGIAVGQAWYQPAGENNPCA